LIPGLCAITQRLCASYLLECAPVTSQLRLTSCAPQIRWYSHLLVQGIWKGHRR